MSYPKIKDDDFYNKITKKYQRYNIPKKRKTFRQICYQKKFTLQQSKKLIVKYINPKTPYNSNIILHEVIRNNACNLSTEKGPRWHRCCGCRR